MTMFSQKAPFDLTEFLGKPATPEARRLRVAAPQALAARLAQRRDCEIATERSEGGRQGRVATFPEGAAMGTPA